MTTQVLSVVGVHHPRPFTFTPPSSPCLVNISEDNHYPADPGWKPSRRSACLAVLVTRISLYSGITPVACPGHCTVCKMLLQATVNDETDVATAELPHRLTDLV